MNPDDRLSELLSDPDVWAEAPDAAAILEQVSAVERRRRLRPWGLVAVAAVVTALVAIGVSVVRGEQDPVDFVLTGTEVAPRAQAAVRIVDTPAGVVLRLEVSGLEPAPPGTYYQGWVAAGDDLVSVGTFHMRGGDGRVSLWSGVDLDAYRLLLVTLQPEGGGPQPSAEVVLRGGS
ncbi:MAG TPA: anti-sigma factor [Acidimicrobiia bacterium]|nr:anti-sigma factor [Acidimicrobiia bacterium]